MEDIKYDAALTSLQDRIKEADPRAIILSGGPNSVHIPGAPQVPEGFFEYCKQNSIPVLGICYGLHLIVQVTELKQLLHSSLIAAIESTAHFWV